MGWLGTLVGGTVGFAMGGPLGAIVGATFGHTFDVEPTKHNGNAPRCISSEEQYHLTFFVAAFSMLAKIAKADGKVSTEEISSIENFITQELKLEGYSRSVAIKIFNTALNSSQTFDAFARQFHNQFYSQPQMLELMIDIMLRVSVADNYLSEAENELLIKACNIFKFDHVTYDRLKSKYIHTSLSKYYSILGCKETESDRNLKSCYRQKVHEYHPDKIIAKGLPEEFSKFANDKFREIQEAWEHIKRERKLK